MATQKFTCPPTPASGQGTFSDNIVGLQLIAGGGFTQANFEFTTSISEKQNRNFDIGSFSDPINLDSLNIENLIESQAILSKNFQVYPNYDLSQITNFTEYGSLTKRISTSVTRIINFFPGALEVAQNTAKFITQTTAFNCAYDAVDNETSLEIYISSIRNPFDIDFSENAARNILLKEVEVSPLRDMTANFKKYSLYVQGNEYPVNYIYPTNDNSTTFTIIVEGNPFSGSQISYDYLVIRPNNSEVNSVFQQNLDPVENFLLNRNVVPIYTASFRTPKEMDNGNYVFTTQNVTFPLSGLWNLDIESQNFEIYLQKLSEFSTNLDEYKTNLISRFLTTGALKEFDTPDQKFEKILQIYGRSFDQTKTFITALANMTNVNYVVKNDIPSQLLKNLAETLGWKVNISPISNEQLLQNVFSPTTNLFPGLSKGQTPEELNYQYYRNLVLNSAYLFKSKGTRKSIECLLRLIGAPDALVEFNEYVYVADQRIDMSNFQQQFLQITGGSFTQQFPVLQTNNVYSILGNPATGFTTSSITVPVTTTREDYPVDLIGCPQMPATSDDFFFQIGGGWFESTPQHRMPEQVNLTNSVFTGNNPDYQTKLLPFNYGEEYLNRYRYFPYMNLGYTLRKISDNKKSWIDSQQILRNSFDANLNAYYVANEECLVLNVKNVDIFMNPAQGLIYDVWSMSREYNFPIPEQGLNYVPPSPCDIPNPYPKRGGIDWTEIVPKPKQKTFFEFAQTFWHNMINVRNRQFITDGKTGGYPTLQSIYWKYLESQQLIGVENGNFTYQTMIDYVNGLGTYWIRLIEQMIPATTIWTTGMKLENSIFHRQKFGWRRQTVCKILPPLCKPCGITTQAFVYDCPGQYIECGLYPWNSDPTVTSFGVLLSNLLQQYYLSENINFNDCLGLTILTNWYVDIRVNGVPIAQDYFFSGSGPAGVPTTGDWVDALDTTLLSLQTLGYSYVMNTQDETVLIYNNNCVPSNDDISINVGISFQVLCNG
jgi:hypothetical protein